LKSNVDSAVKELSELVLAVLSNTVELLDDLFLWKRWVNELHFLQVVDDSGVEGFFNEGHGDFPFGFLRFKEDLLAVLVVGDNALQHTNGLWKWAVVIVL